MGDLNEEVTEDKMDEAQLSKAKAIKSMSEGKHVRINSLIDDFE